MTVPGRNATGTSTLALGVGCLLACVVLAGCANFLEGDPGTGGSGGPDAGPYEHPTGAEDVVVSVQVAGGYVPVEYNLRNTAQFLLLGDGTVIVAGVVIEIYPGPAINPMQSTRVDEDQIQALLTAADDAGLLAAEIDYGQPAVTDQPDTVVTITADGRTVSQSAYGLGFDDESSPELSEASRAARLALRDFIDTAQALAGTDSQIFTPTGVVAYRLSEQAAPPPEEPDLAQEPRPWPIATAPPPVAGTELTSCVVITGAESDALLAALQQANELTPWLIATDPPARMAFRPLLPGDPGCG